MFQLLNSTCIFLNYNSNVKLFASAKSYVAAPTMLEPIRAIFIGQTHSFSMDEDMLQYTTKLYKLLKLQN